jgi:PAS domain S-box-containing protein
MNKQDIHTHLDKIIDTIQDGVMLINPQGRIIMVNKAMSTLTGYTREELLEAHCGIFDCDVCAKARTSGKHWCKLFDIGKENRKECHIRQKNGRYLHVLKTASLLRKKSGEIIAAVETLTDISEIDRKTQRIEELKKVIHETDSFYGMIGQSAAMRQTFALLKKAAASPAPVIIFGESGTGKELAAHAIHALGPRSDNPFVQINCAAFNTALLESEIFGHTKGAFTGAYRHRIGRFEEASGGDLFLDEIGDIPLSLQVKLLRVLETGIFERVGENTPIQLDARLISATNQNLQEKIHQNEFREDFFYRINVIPIHIPALRERTEDIPLLVTHFLQLINTTRDTPIQGISPETLEIMTQYNWPGNIRELKSALEYASVVCEGNSLGKEHLPRNIVQKPQMTILPDSSTHEENHYDKQKQELIDALKQAEGNKSQAARLLGVTRLTVLNRMRKYGVNLQKNITS